VQPWEHKAGPGRSPQEVASTTSSGVTFPQKNSTRLKHVWILHIASGVPRVGVDRIAVPHRKPLCDRGLRDTNVESSLLQ
jgi:hypothetical protein